MSEQLMVYCTCPDQGVAGRIASELVAQGHAACANIVPGLVSVYQWQGEIHNDPEALLLIKTSAQAYAGLEARILELHPYELPEIVAVPLARGLRGYLDWIDHETGAAQPQ